ncbi:MAG: prolipoprotein diacylglyceryl transferase [Proteobacteria bacterium]|nr:prolipoprotein diacylglyceryl transferase [Pseudomonadota bacterium]MBU1710779.1 prolipoprotein diacylglyceryl transferase [Pseudomonadota bacterium]
MISYPHIDPVIIGIGPLQVRWYGLMYVMGFMATYFLVRHQIQKRGLKKLEAHFENINMMLIICLVLGGRLGYVLFYNFSYYMENPLEILATWHGGMSFHGALIGIVVSGYVYAKLKKLDYWEGADVYAVTTPIGLGLGRIGNFINGELFGRTTDVPWAMVFPGGGPYPRHPSQLYECFLEGVVLFTILWILKDRKWPSGTMLSFYLILYGIFRWFIELFREPDANLGFVLGPLTMGQLLSTVMIVAGTALFFYRRKVAPIAII